MIKVKLSRLEAWNTALRTDSIVGECFNLPQVGDCFIMIAPPLESGDERRVTTSPVQDVAFIQGEYRIRTKNHKYSIRVLDV